MESHVRSLLYVTQEGNNCLHIAARFGYEELVERVVNLCPYNLVYQQNKTGDNPLHVAARAGHLHVVKLLTDSFQRHQPPQSSQSIGITEIRAVTGDGIPSERSRREAEEGGIKFETQEGKNKALDDSKFETQEEKNKALYDSDVILTGITSDWPSLPIWRTQNKDGSTALHEALRSKNEDVALHLLDLDTELVVLAVSAEDESPLYLAAKAGFVCVLNRIFFAGGWKNAVGPSDQTPLHGAVFAKSAEGIEVLHELIPGIMNKQDSFGKTALYYAIQENSIEIMRLLMKLDPSSACICDNEGLSPLLVAATIGTPASIRAILDELPTSIESTDHNGQNALHLAVMNYTVECFQELLRMPEMVALINKSDGQGNTPLQLASLYKKYLHGQALLSMESVREKQIRNALDKEKASKDTDDNLKDDLIQDISMSGLSVVATLLATITFMGAFTVPGGYMANGLKAGSPLLMKKPALVVFFLADSFAFFSSMMALVIIATKATTMSSRNSFLALAFVSNASHGAIIAFMTGLYVVLSIESKWMAILVCFFGSSCIVYIQDNLMVALKSIRVRLQTPLNNIFRKSLNSRQEDDAN